MPSKSEKQVRTMRAAAHNKAFAKKLNIPQDVARDFVTADAKGGTMKKDSAMSKKMDKMGNVSPKKAMDMKGSGKKKYAKGGSIDGCAQRGKTKGRMM